MAEFLRNTSHILSKIDATVIQAKEYVYLVSPGFSEMPPELPTKLWDALKRGVKVMLMYREITSNVEAEFARLQHTRFLTFHHPHLNTNAYFNEKEAVLTTFNLFGPIVPDVVEFGMYFRKMYAADGYGQLLNEFRGMLAHATKMLIDDGRLAPEEEVWARRKQAQESRIPEDEPVAVSTKVLSIKEKQEFILKLFARENKDCTLKIEDAERVRIVGKGMVMALSNERVDLIFVHYNTYQSRIEEIKQFVTQKHPDLKAWFQYNRVNMKLESESDITNVFFTLREAVALFNLV